MLYPPSLVFVTLVNNAEEESSARLFSASLRRFGGELSDAPIWVFHPSRLAPESLRHGTENIHLFPLEIAERIQKYPFADKAAACAQAEAMTGKLVGTLVWVNPGCLVTRPPLLFSLEGTTKAAFRPVHLRNVGSLASQPLNAYWSTIYSSIGLQEAPYSITSFTDGQQIRPYFNTHCFAVDTVLGLMRAWLRSFEELILDASYQVGACASELQKIFLHQAVLSALLTRDIPETGLRLLPPDYSYPLHLHQRVPPALQAASLNALTVPVYEDAFEYPTTLNGLAAEEPLAGWLAKNNR